jgi:uncharacterized membrane-anchored protein
MRRTLFHLLVALQVLFLLGQAARVEMAISRATVVTLKVVPIDPRSLFMGNYMALNLDIMRLDMSKVRHDKAVESLNYGDTVYVELAAGCPYARALSVSTTRPSGLYLKGRMEYLLHAEVLGPEGGTEQGPPREMVVDYGLDRYFIPESRQGEVEDLAVPRHGKTPEIAVEVAVTSTGKSFLRRVLVDGKPLPY